MPYWKNTGTTKIDIQASRKHDMPFAPYFAMHDSDVNAIARFVMDEQFTRGSKIIFTFQEAIASYCG